MTLNDCNPNAASREPPALQHKDAAWRSLLMWLSFCRLH